MFSLSVEIHTFMMFPVQVSQIIASIKMLLVSCFVHRFLIIFDLIFDIFENFLKEGSSNLDPIDNTYGKYYK